VFSVDEVIVIGRAVVAAAEMVGLSGKEVFMREGKT
jgi:hypothetical protein